MSAATGLPALDNTMGALFLSIIIAMGLWGAGCVQMYYYYDSYRNDRWYLKSLVFVVWALDTAHQGMIIHSGYIYLVTEYANPLFLNTIVTSLELMVLFSGFVIILVQAFLIYRVWILSKGNTYLAAFLVVLSLGEFASTLAYFIKGSALSLFSDVGTQLGWLSRLVNAMGAVTDTCIAAALCVLLQRGRTGFRRSDTLINRLILFTINAGLATSVFAVLGLVFVTAYPSNLIYVTMYVPISRLYTNSLLATLNNRQSARSANNTENDPSGPGGISFASGSAGNVELRNRLPQHFAIKVETETQRMRDVYNQDHTSFALESLRKDYESGDHEEKSDAI